MKMSKVERSQCEAIIEYHVQNAIGGSLKTKFGTTVNLEEITKMTRALAKVFKVSIKKTLAKNMVINALKESANRIVIEEFIKMLPRSYNTDNTFSKSLTQTAVNLAGWQIASEFANQRG